MKHWTSADRFLNKVDRSDPFGCWLWTAAINPGTGYARFWIPGAGTVNAHRFAYELAFGPIPDGLDVDHLCRVRSCVRPSHLEPVTRRENLMRGDTLARAHSEGRFCGSTTCPSCQRHLVGAAS